MAEQVLAENDFEDDFSDIDMEELDSYLTSPPGVAGAADSPAESARAAARARLAARAAHGDGRGADPRRPAATTCGSDLHL